MTRENSMFRLGGEILGMISSAKYCVENQLQNNILLFRNRRRVQKNRWIKNFEFSNFEDWTFFHEIVS